MNDLAFRRLQEGDLQVLEAWFADPELRLRISWPTMTWFEHVTTRNNVYTWMVYEHETPIGYVQIDVEGRSAWVAGAVNPQLRQRGYGTAILNALLKRPEVADLDQIAATVEPDNVASQRCLARVGFKSTGSQPDDDGFLRFTREIRDYCKG